MILLEPGDYELAALGLKDVSINNLFARSVVEQHVGGRIYVDDVNQPGAFYVVHPYGMSLLYGDIGEEFLQSHLINYLLNRNGIRDTDEFLQVFPTELEKRIDATLGENLCVYDGNSNQDYSDYAVVKHKRINFKFNLNKFEKFRSEIDLSGYNFREVDESLYNETNGSVVPNKFWDNFPDFALSGIGFSLIHEEQAVAVAFSSFIHEGMLELGMETKTEYRRKGFASIISAKLIEFCLNNDFEPIWACRLGNQGSYNLAIKLGFEPTVYLPYYELLI